MNEVYTLIFTDEQESKIILGTYNNESKAYNRMKKHIEITRNNEENYFILICELDKDVSFNTDII